MVSAASVAKYVTIVPFEKARHQEGSFHSPTHQTTSTYTAESLPGKKPSVPKYSSQDEIVKATSNSASNDDL